MNGYDPNSKGYKLWDAILKKLIISPDARFEEAISDPSFEVEDNATSSSKSILNIEIDSESENIDDIHRL